MGSCIFASENASQTYVDCEKQCKTHCEIVRVNNPLYLLSCPLSFISKVLFYKIFGRNLHANKGANLNDFDRSFAILS